MVLQPHPDSLLGRLAQLPDPCARDGCRYPLATLLGLVFLGVLHGHASLHSAWCWARTRWRILMRFQLQDAEHATEAEEAPIARRDPPGTVPTLGSRRHHDREITRTPGNL